MEVRIAPGFGGGIVIPDSAIQAGFVVESADGEEIFELINDPEPEVNPRFGNTTLHFALNLEPGEYKIVGLLGIHPDLGEDPVSFPPFRFGEEVGIFGFTVPESGCVHMGQISVAYLRIAPGTRSQQDHNLKKISEQFRSTVYYSYLKTGSLISDWAQAARILKRSWDEEAIRRDCDFTHTRWGAE